MLGAFGEEAIKQFVGEAVNEAMRLENALHTLTTERTVIVLQYAPITDNLEGEPMDIFPFLDSSRLAEPIDRCDLSADLHGHAHDGRDAGTTTNGPPGSNCDQRGTKEGGKRATLTQGRSDEGNR